MSTSRGASSAPRRLGTDYRVISLELADQLLDRLSDVVQHLPSGVAGGVQPGVEIVEGAEQRRGVLQLYHRAITSPNIRLACRRTWAATSGSDEKTSISSLPRSSIFTPLM